MSSNLDRGSKIRIAIAIVLALAFMVVLIFNIQLRMMPEWENTSLHYELGEKVDIKATDVLSRNSHSFTVDTSKINENEPGVYIVEASFNSVAGKQVKYLRVTISDTKKPTFTKAPKTVKVKVGNDTYDFRKKFKATDQTKVSLTFDTSAVDFNTPGTYTAKVTASDSSGNERTKKFKVKIVASTSQDTTNESTTQQDTTQDTTTQQATTDDSTSTYDSNASDYYNGTDGTYDGSDTYTPTTPYDYDTSEYDPSLGWNTAA